MHDDQRMQTSALFVITSTRKNLDCADAEGPTTAWSPPRTISAEKRLSSVQPFEFAGMASNNLDCSPICWLPSAVVVSAAAIACDVHLHFEERLSCSSCSAVIDTDRVLPRPKVQCMNVRHDGVWRFLGVWHLAQLRHMIHVP